MAKESEQKPYVNDDPEMIKDAKVKAKIDANRDDNDIKFLMSTVEFRRYAWKILERTHIFHTSFTGNSETFMKEGERNIGLMVFLAIQKNCPDLYAVMVKENT
jgi:hypothetical protein